MAILVAIAVNEYAHRKVCSAAKGTKDGKASWVSLFQWLRSRGLDGVKLIVGDKCFGFRLQRLNVYVISFLHDETT